MQVAVAIRKADDAIAIRAVEILRFGTRRIKGYAERLAQLAVCKKFAHVRLAVAVRVAQDLDLIGALSLTNRSPLGAGSR